MISDSKAETRTLTIFRGSTNDSPLIKKGSHVTSMFERAAKYARYPNNGEGVQIGFIFQLSIEENNIDWDERLDCEQGRLKCDVMAEKFTICDVQVNLANRDSPIRKLGFNKPWIWADGSEIEWKFVGSGSN